MDSDSDGENKWRGEVLCLRCYRHLVWGIRCGNESERMGARLGLGFQGSCFLASLLFSGHFDYSCREWILSLTLDVRMVFEFSDPLSKIFINFTTSLS